MEREESWHWKDVGPGALLFTAGSLVIACVLLAMRSGLPSLLWTPGWILGLVLLLIGAHAIYRGLRSLRSDETSA